MTWLLVSRRGALGHAEEGANAVRPPEELVVRQERFEERPALVGRLEYEVAAHFHGLDVPVALCRVPVCCQWGRVYHMQFLLQM